ncbi:MAG: ribosome small subunit-dependent GTPase A [Clostridia bacterium]|nr:ribosome small subunit-dependent GTPase A [Clostridia bacterium]
MITTTGTIIKGIGGFYYVEAADGIYECRARGAFRKEGVTPLVGDRVSITINEGEHENTIDEIFPRDNELRRHPVANIDRLFIIVASTEPRPNPLVIDRLTAIAVRKGIEPVIVLNKADLKDVADLKAIYEKTPFPVVVTNGLTGEGTETLKTLLEGRTCAFTGNSGVGKSTLLNALDPELDLATAAISKKLGRGRHTTRECTLLKVCGGYVVDTPGFASLEFARNELVLKEELEECFPEFEPYIARCKFHPSCAHMNDKGCAVTEAVEQGVISESRYRSYRAMYDEVKDLEAWQLKSSK